MYLNISTHTPHARRDVSVDEESKKYIVFQLTRLMRGVTISRSSNRRRSRFQLTRLMRGVTQRRVGCIGCPMISTHTPHARRDYYLQHIPSQKNISTHTPHARRDYMYLGICFFCSFISTHTPHARRDERYAVRKW